MLGRNAGLVVSAAFTLAGALSGAAEAAHPGLNGRIVFASNRSPLIPGELYTVGSAGGIERRLTSNWVEERSPSASPVDGRVAFVRGGWIVIRTPRGRERAVARVRASANGPLWSPDGRQLLYTAGRGEDQLDVYVVRASGDARRRRLGTHRRNHGPPAWSPDSRRVAVIGRDQQLLTIEIASGRLTRLTRGKARLSNPTWSPDGSRLAFFRSDRRSAIVVMRLRDRRLRRLSLLYPGEGAVLTWSPRADRLLVGGSGVGYVHVVPLRGRSRRVTGRGGSPVWSPDGRWIAYLSGIDNELWVMWADGTHKRRLVRPREGHVLSGQTWTADSRRILFNRGLDDSQGPVDADLYTMRADGSAVLPLIRSAVNEGVPEHDPSYSPDGSQVAYSCGRRLCVFDLTAGGRRTLASGLYGYVSPSWSPDGSQLVFQGIRQDTNDKEKFFTNLYVVGADGSALSQLIPGARPSWSPDGRRIAYSRSEFGSDNLYVLDLADRRERNISNQPWWHERFGFFDDAPDWAPSGDAIVMASMRGLEEDGGCNPFCPPSDLFALPPEGGEVRRITRSQGAFDPAWSPDGRFIVYEDLARITVVSRTGGRPRRLTRGPGVDLTPSWQPRCTRAGTRAANVMRGTAAKDLFCGFGGNDTLEGGAGEDRLFGGPGADSLRARDGGWDVVGCGPGEDTVDADALDLVGADCERVARG